MRNMADMAAEALPTSTPQQESFAGTTENFRSDADELHDRIAGWVWRALGEQFGAGNLKARYGSSTPTGEWRRMLRELAPEQVKAAVLRCRFEGREWPPSCGQFATWARQPPPAEPAHREFPPLLEEGESARRERFDHQSAMLDGCLRELGWRT